MQHYTLKQNRNRIEYEILKYQSTLAPGLVPEVYSYDPIMNCTSMEDLSDHVIMRTEMINHKQFKKFADDITTFMVNTLLLTSDVCMEHKAKKELVKNFINPELCEISEDLVYTEPFSDINNRNDIFAPNVEWVKENIYSDEALKLETAKLKFDFMNNAQAYEKASEYTAKYKGFKEYYLDTVLRDIAAVTGLEGIRRIVGIAHVKNITSVQDEEKKTIMQALFDKGSFYRKHLDQFQDNSSRQFSMITYLNENWQPEDGGELCIYDGDVTQKIAPTNRKTVFFKSNELVHEVLESHKPRLSVTGWLRRD